MVRGVSESLFSWCVIWCVIRFDCFEGRLAGNQRLVFFLVCLHYFIFEKVDVGVVGRRGEPIQLVFYDHHGIACSTSVAYSFVPVSIKKAIHASSVVAVA
jgi:hypothetical protein